MDYESNNTEVSEEPAASTFRTEGKASFSEPLATIYQTTRRHIHEDTSLYSNNPLTFKSHWSLPYRESSILERRQQADYGRNKEERSQFGNSEN